MSAAAHPRDRLPHVGEVMVGAMLSMTPRCLEDLLSATPTLAAPWVRAAAEQGLVQGQLRWGRLLLEGRGVARDERRALTWFRAAADAGAAEARNMVGRCLENGWGVPADPASAAGWYRRAALAGDPWGAYNLGHLHLNGLGVVRDARAAVGWYALAARRGHARAMNLLGRCREAGWGARPSWRAARAWYRRSAERGYFRGEYNFATLLAGEGRLDEAAEMFARAMKQAPPATRVVMAQALAGAPEGRLAAIGRTALAIAVAA